MIFSHGWTFLLRRGLDTSNINRAGKRINIKGGLNSFDALLKKRYHELP
jgi:hypothetical protein